MAAQPAFNLHQIGARPAANVRAVQSRRIRCATLTSRLLTSPFIRSTLFILNCELPNVSTNFQLYLFITSQTTASIASNNLFPRYLDEMVTFTSLIAVAALAAPALAQNTRGCGVQIVAASNNQHVYSTGCVPLNGEAWVRGEINLRVRATRYCGLGFVDANGQFFEPANVSLRSLGQTFC